MSSPGAPQNSNACARCGSPLPTEASECPDCGRPVSGPPEPDHRIYTLLSAANLARMRGQWQVGIDKCVEALRLDPYNPTAHSLVGDIYQDQGRREEAIQWYRLALDLDPNNAADQAKLERARTPLITEPARRPPFWIRVGVPSAVILAFLMMSIGVWALITAQDRDSPAVPDEANPPQLRLPEDLRPQKGYSLPFHLRPAAPHPPVAATAPAVETPLETQLRAGLQSRLGRVPSVAGVALNPGDGSAIITLLMADAAPLQPDALVQALFTTSFWAYRQDADLRRCQIRVLRRLRPDASPELAVVADSTREAVLSVAANTPAAAAGTEFQLWWSPQLFPARPRSPADGAQPSPSPALPSPSLPSSPPPLPFPSSPRRSPS